MRDELDDLLVATSDYGDDALDENVQVFLAKLRERTDMDVVFVAKIADGERTFKAVASRPDVDLLHPGMSDPVEQSWCHMIVSGRLPEIVRDAKPLIDSGAVPYTPLSIGTHLSVPVMMPNGAVYGTLCCFALSVKQDDLNREVEHLREAAGLIGRRLAPKADRCTASAA